MAFFTSAVTGLKTVVTAIGAGVAVWGVINLLEGYKITRGQAAHGGWRYCNCGTDGNSAAYKPVFLSHGSDSRQDN